jgi:hypothetical protein
LSRKSPAPKPKLSGGPAPQSDSLPAKRITFLLDYITRINRQSLIALYQLYGAPDCQVGEVPALLSFDHYFEAQNFHATGFLTKPQVDVLEKAANQSLDALMGQAFQLALSLFQTVTAAETSLVAALMNPPTSKGGVAPNDDPPPPPPQTGCCYYSNSPPISNVPQDLCESDPDYLAWVGGVACPIC